MKSAAVSHANMSLLKSKQRTSRKADAELHHIILVGSWFGEAFQEALSFWYSRNLVFISWDTHSTETVFVLLYLTKWRHRGARTHQRKLLPTSFFLIFLFVLLIVGLNIDFSALKNWRHSIFFCHVFNMLKMKKALYDHIFPLQKCEQLAQQILISICIIYCKMYIIGLADSKSTNTSINLFMIPYVIVYVDGLLLQQDVTLNNWCRCTVAN